MLGYHLHCIQILRGVGRILVPFVLNLFGAFQRTQKGQRTQGSKRKYIKKHAESGTNDEEDGEARSRLTINRKNRKRGCPGVRSVKCVCIDSPYNTGNEGWNYNVLKIERRLGEAVRKERI